MTDEAEPRCDGGKGSLGLQGLLHVGHWSDDGTVTTKHGNTRCSTPRFHGDALNPLPSLLEGINS